jgi:putative sigma-54 modulation protein
MSVEKSRQKLETTIHSQNTIYRVEEITTDMYASIDKAIDVIERQIRKNKTRLSRRIHENAFKSAEADDVNFIVEESDYHIERTKKFQIKPMTVDEAILQMNLLGHEFFVFYNSESRSVNVVYRRKEGNYGLIEPEY